MQAGGQYSTQLRSTLDDAIACIEPYISDALVCRLGVDGSANQTCYDANSELQFEDYSAVDMAARFCIAHQGYALRQSVIDVANALGVPATCHSFHKDSVYPFKCAAHLACLRVAGARDVWNGHVWCCSERNSLQSLHFVQVQSTLPCP